MAEAEQVEEVVEELSLSDSLAAAWDDSDETEDDDVPRGIMEASDGDDGNAGGIPDINSEKPNTDNKEGVQPAEGEGEPATAEGAESLETAPKSLSPAAREAWKKAPDALKKDIAKRERDYEAGIVKYADNAKRAQAMDNTLAPFQQYMQMNGGPAKSIQTLLQTGASLQMGSPQQKAQMVANLIKQYGVDIRTLDNMIVGVAAPQDVQENTAVDQRIQQAIAPYQQMMNEFQHNKQQQQQQTQHKVATDVQQFSKDPKNEFYNDVQGMMADIMDVEAKSNRFPGMQETYDKACMLHPEISKIVQARQAAESMGKKRQAATSIHGTPSGGGDAGAPGSLRETLANAWDDVGRA
jgi:hypothetical protein